jgi:ADP-ribosyl-[dinitrogen reductase] hydrolase
MRNDKGYLGLRGSSDVRISGLIGLRVGDALGLPFDFKTPNGAS